MIKFQVKDYALIIDEACLTIKEFKALVDYDKGKHKAQALQDLLYVYLLWDEDSPYVGTDVLDRDRAVKKNVYLDEYYVWEPARRKLVEAAVAMYRWLNDTVEGRTLASLDKRIEAVQVFLDQHVEIKTKEDIREQVALATDVTSLLEKKAKLKDTIAKAGKTKVRNKADSISSPLETGQIRDVNTLRQQRRDNEQPKPAPQTTEQKTLEESVGLVLNYIAEDKSADALSEYNENILRSVQGANSLERYQDFVAKGGKVPDMAELEMLFNSKPPEEQARIVERIGRSIPQDLRQLTGMLSDDDF